MNKTEKKLSYSNAGIILLLLVFLVFGFCPLRNALSALVRQVPQTTAPKAPEYVKIIAHDDCSLAVATPLTATIGKLHIPPAQVAWLPETDQVIGLQFLILIDGYQSCSLTAAAIPNRIYLRNRCLLI